MKFHFIANSVFSTSLTGGDIHFLKLAEAVLRAGHELHFFGGHALSELLAQQNVSAPVTLTDAAKMPKVNQTRLQGQLVMFRDFLGRYRRIRPLLDEIQPGDVVYAVSDYWFDVLPTVRCKAERKMMVLHMAAPTLGQVITRGRPDVDAKRLASFHYWMSQTWSLHRFAGCKRRHLLYLHPLMEPWLTRLGIAPENRTLMSFGLDIAAADAVPEQRRDYDVIWIGRVHRQKGIEDLLATIQYLANRLENFRAVIIGNVRDALLPQLKQLGVEANVTFSGFVDEAEKIRLFKASRVFLMPSTYEGSPRVVGESIIAGARVVAYDLANYRPIFGDLVRYVPSFDRAAFQKAAEDQIRRLRAGADPVEESLADFRRQHAWEATQERFLKAVSRL